MRLYLVFILFILLHGCNNKSEDLTFEKSLSLLITDTGSSRATGYNDSNKVIETDSTITISWLGSQNSEFVIQLIQYDKRTNGFGEIINLDTDVDDNHGGPAIVIDSKGIFHIIYGSHVSPFRYRRSVNPGRIDEWTEVEYIGNNLTYPSLVVDSMDGLHLVARETNWNENSQLVYFKRPKEGTWSNPTNLISNNHTIWKQEGYSFDYSSNAKTGYGRFRKSLIIDTYDVLHLGFQVLEFMPKELMTGFEYENGMRGYIVGYLKSDDLGDSWKANEQNVNLPVTTDEIEIIAGDPNPLNTDFEYVFGNLVVNSSGIPSVVYSRHDKENTHLFISSRESGIWEEQQLLDPNETNQLISPSSLAIVNDKLYLVTTVIDTEEYCICFSNWANHSNYVNFYTVHGGQLDMKYSSSDIQSSWLPAIQKQHYYGQSISILFISGSQGVDASDGVHTNLFWHRLFE